MNRDIPPDDQVGTVGSDHSVTPEGGSGPCRDPRSGSTWEHRNGFDIIHLYGDPYERGLAHGTLLRAKIRASRVAEYYGRFVDQLYRSSDFVRKIPAALRAPIGRLMEWRYYAPLERLLMEETRVEMEGIAEGAQIDVRLGLRGLLAPDVLEALAAGFLRSGKQSQGNYYLSGCSTAYARGDACAHSAATYFGRNMDFPGVFVWKHPTIIFAHPTEEVETLVAEGGGFAWKKKRKQPYMYLTTAGFPGFGLTGMNASGVAMGTYVCVSRNVGGRSRLFLDYNHFLLTRTESVEGIEHLLRTEHPSCVSPHATVFASANDALTVEVDSRQVSARRLGPDFDLLAQTNHFANPRLKLREIEYPLATENSIGRYRVVHSALEESYGELDPQRMVDIMAGNVDLAGRRPGLLGDFPAQPTTLTSVVFELGSGDFWVAGGVPPAVCYNTYYGFNFYDELAGRRNARRLKSYRKSVRPIVEAADPQPVSDAAKESLRQLMLSQELLKKGRRRAALGRLARAIALEPDSGYRYVYGILLLAEGRYAEALEIFDSLDQPYLFPHVKETALQLWKARSLDLLGRRPEALAIYRDLLRDGNLAPHLRRIVSRGLRRPFDRKAIPASFDYTMLGPLLF